MDCPVAFRTRIALAEMVLEVEVADVLGVVVARNDHGGEPLLQRPQCITGGEELGGVPLLGEVSGDNDEVRGQLLDLSDRVCQEPGIEERRPAVQIGKLGDYELGHVRPMLPTRQPGRLTRTRYPTCVSRSRGPWMHLVAVTSGLKTAVKPAFLSPSSSWQAH